MSIVDDIRVREGTHELVEDAKQYYAYGICVYNFDVTDDARILIRSGGWEEK